MAREARQASDTALAAIEAVLVTTAEWNAPNPRVMSEIIAAQARLGSFGVGEPIELAERLLFLDDAPGATELPDGGLGAILPELVEEAVARGELPPQTDVSSVVLAIASIFFGVPLVLGQASPRAVAPMYRQQLHLIWAGAQAE